MKRGKKCFVVLRKFINTCAINHLQNAIAKKFCITTTPGGSVFNNFQNPIKVKDESIGIIASVV